MDNANSRLENLLATLNEWGVKTEGLGYRDAVIAYKDFSKQKLNDKDFKVLFGDFGVVSADYDLLLDTELEQARKYLAACKKQHKGVKINVRTMATLGYKGKTLAAVAEPGRVLWELSGVSDEDAAEIAAGLSDITGAELEIISAQ